MRVRFGGQVVSGMAIDLRAVDVDGGTVVDALGDPGDDRVVCSGSSPVSERVGVVCRGMGVAVRTVVAVAMRTRRIETPYDRALARTERELGTLDSSSVSVTDLRARLAALTERESRLRERVARLGGRVQALRDRGVSGVTEVERDLEAAVGRLAEVETERVAAEQRLDRVRERLRDTWSTADERRRLADRIDNLRRDARDYLVELADPVFVDAVGAVPGPSPTDPSPSAFDGPDWVAALASIVIAALDGPVVVGDDVGFRTATAAHDILGVPVILVEV